MKHLFTIAFIFLFCSMGFSQTQEPTNSQVRAISQDSLKLLQPGEILYPVNKTLFVYSGANFNSKFTTIEPGEQLEFVKLFNPQIMSLKYKGKLYYCPTEGTTLSKKRMVSATDIVVRTDARNSGGNLNLPKNTNPDALPSGLRAKNNEAGQLLVKHQQVFIQGITVGLLGTVLVTASPFTGSLSNPLGIAGGVAGLIGTIIVIDSQKYIKRAGLELMSGGAGIGLVRKF